MVKEGEYDEPEHMRKLFIGGLNYTTSDDSLKSYFEQYGEIVDFIVMKDPMTYLSKGFGFVTFSSASMVDDVQKDCPHEIDGRIVDTKRAIPKDEIVRQGTSVKRFGGLKQDGDKQDEYDEPEQMRKLFIGGLDYRTNDTDLKTYFEQYGEIVDVVVMKDPKTSRSRGFGFVAFSRAYMVDEAQKDRPHKIDGRTVDTKRAIPKDEIGRREGASNVKRLFVGGLKEEMDEDDLREVFSQFGEIESISIPTEKETNKMRGFAFIEYADYDAVDKACIKRDVTVCNKRVEVKKAVSRSEMERRGGNRMGGGRDRGGGGGRGNSWGGGGGGGRNNNWDDNDGWSGNQNPWNNNNNYGNNSGGGYNQNPWQGGQNPWQGGGGGGGNGQGGGQGGWGSQGSGSNQWGGSQGSSGGGGGGYGGGNNQFNPWNQPSNSFGNDYNQNYGGGPVRGQNYGNQGNRSTPYNSGGNYGNRSGGGGRYEGKGSNRRF